MGVFESFLVGFVSSVFATFVSAYLLVLTSKRARWFITGILGRLTHHDIEFVYKDKKEAEKDYESEIKQTKKIYLMTSRGNELQRGAFSDLVNNKPKDRKIDFRIILPKLKLESCEFDFVNQREEEISEFDVAFRQKSGLLKQQIKLNIDFLTNLKINENDIGISLNYANMPHFARILITDNFLYFEPYNKNRHGTKDPVLKFRRGETYNAFSRYFDLVWQSQNADF